MYNDSEFSVNNEIEKLERELDTLRNEEKHLQTWIYDLKSHHEDLNNDQKFKDYCYLTYDDIKLLTRGEDINLIAIRAPNGTTLELPEPENVKRIYQQTEQSMKMGLDKYDKDLLDCLQKHHQLFIESPNGEINVFLVLSSDTNKSNKTEKFFSFDEHEKILVDSKVNQPKITNENINIGVDI